MPAPLMLGCDPGVVGGLALVYDDGTAEAYRMPETESDLIDLCRELASRWSGHGTPRATVEFVRSSSQMGVVSAFTFGRGYGSLRTALIAAGFSLTEMTPAKWQRSLGMLARGDKKALRARAREMFPVVRGDSSRVTAWSADALLIARSGSGR